MGLECYKYPIVEYTIYVWPCDPTAYYQAAREGAV